jgi:hypothetical protein
MACFVQVGREVEETGSVKFVVASHVYDGRARKLRSCPTQSAIADVNIARQDDDVRFDRRGIPL